MRITRLKSFSEVHLYPQHSIILVVIFTFTRIKEVLVDDKTLLVHLPRLSHVLFITIHFLKFLMQKTSLNHMLILKYF